MATQAEIDAVVAWFKGFAPALSDDVAEQCTGIFEEWSGEGLNYTAGERVQYKDVLYSCLQDHTSQADWTPAAAPSLWSKVLASGDESTPEDEIPEWVQPDSTNGYSKGAKVKHNSKTWKSLVDNNVWEPGVTGTETVWSEVA